MNRISLFLIFLFSISNVSFSQKKHDYKKVSDITRKYNLTFISDSIVPTCWDSVKYESVQKDSLNKYLILLKKEIEKYPSDFFSKIGINKIILCADLRIGSQKRAAVPDSEMGQLFLSVYNTTKFYTDAYKCHVFHHELNHCTEYTLWKDYYYKWDEWAKLNSDTVKYGNGGVEAYKHPKQFNWRSTKYRKVGFMNMYSTLGQEEDRSEIVAFIMTNKERDTIRNLIKTDIVLKQKVILLNNFYKERFNYKSSFFRKYIKNL